MHSRAERGTVQCTTGGSHVPFPTRHACSTYTYLYAPAPRASVGTDADVAAGQHRVCPPRTAVYAPPGPQQPTTWVRRQALAANLIHRPPRPSALRPSRPVRGSCSLRCPPRPHPRRARPASCPSLQPLATMTPARAPAAALPAHFAVAALLLSPAAAAVLKCQSARFPLVDCCGAVRCRPVRVMCPARGAPAERGPNGRLTLAARVCTAYRTHTPFLPVAGATAAGGFVVQSAVDGAAVNCRRRRRPPPPRKRIGR